MQIENPIKKHIPLPKGGVLELDATPAFLEVVKKHFELSSTIEVSDDHIRMYIWGAFKNAMERAEKGEGYVETAVG